VPTALDVIVPVKPLRRAKSRLRGAADGGRGDEAAHAALVLAMLADTLAAVTATGGVRRAVVITAEATVAEALRGTGIEVLGDPTHSLNEALELGAARLHEADPACALGALGSDLPALRPAELETALANAGDGRWFCPDRHGVGTTLLLSGAGRALAPRFEGASAAAHAATGARPLPCSVPGLACDVDTAADLAVASGLGLGSRTAALLGSEKSTRRTLSSQLPGW
jgi:2-phospho-L-lactate guanylyltransferase